MSKCLFHRDTLRKGASRLVGALFHVPLYRPHLMAIVTIADFAISSESLSFHARMCMQEYYKLNALSLNCCSPRPLHFSVWYPDWYINWSPVTWSHLRKSLPPIVAPSCYWELPTIYVSCRKTVLPPGMIFIYTRFVWRFDWWLMNLLFYCYIYNENYDAVETVTRQTYTCMLFKNIYTYTPFGERCCKMFVHCKTVALLL